MTPTRSCRPFGLLVLLATLAPTTPAHAGGTAKFDVSSADQLDNGEPVGTFISSEGEVLPGRAVKRIHSGLAMIYTSARGPDGTLYLGTGDQAHLLAVKGGKVRRVADLGAVLITALVNGPDGSLLAATMPGSRILRVDPKSGKWSQLTTVPADHVWALLYDAKQRTVYAATGSPGKIFSVGAKGGKPQEYYDPGEQHLLCLTRGPQGALLTGSADKAILYRVTGRGKGRALHDFDGTELRDIAVAPNRAIYVAVNKFKLKTSGMPRVDRSKDGEQGTPVGTSKKKKSKSKVRAQELRPGAKTGKGGVFRVDLDGNAESLLDLGKGYFTDLAVDPAGVLWAGDGTKGRVYQIRSDRSVLTAFDLPERQVLTLAVGGKEQLLGTGDAGALYSVAPGPGPKAYYLTEALDAKFPARWGALTYRGAGTLRVESRSGNTAKPDDTWSGWKATRGAGKNRASLASPAGRYLQLRFNLGGASALLRSFTVFYRPRNQRARVTEITHERKDAGKADKPRSPVIKFKWKTDNPDKDTLVYRVYARLEMGSSWRLISGHEPLVKAELEWDTEREADGGYRIKVVASDERANGTASTLEGARVSARVLVDNRKPEVVGLTARYPWVSGMVRDSLSPISRIEASVDGGPWRVVDPADGIFDSTTERFRFRLWKPLGAGTHLITVRGVDSAENTGTAQRDLVR